MDAMIPAPSTGMIPRLNAAFETLNRLLTPGETIAHSCIQLSFGAYIGISRRYIVTATNQRFIVLKRNIFGGFSMLDSQWRDVEDIRIKENIFPSILGCDFSARTKRGLLYIKGLPSQQALALYSFCQQREQEWREKNRVREMEESRAKAGGVMIGGGHGPGAPQAPVADIMAKLQQLQQMREAGTLTDVEFETMKAKVLAA